MLPDQTDFVGNAIGIDPSGCGCLECGNGSSIPEDDTDRIAEAVKAHFDEGREIISRISCPVVVYRTRSGRYEHLTMPYHGLSETEIVNRADYFDPETADYSTAITDDYAPSAAPEDAVDVHDEIEMQILVGKHFRDGEELVNMTSETLVLYRTRYGEFGHVSVDADEGMISVIMT